MSVFDALPAWLVEALIEARQHDCSVRSGQHGTHQFRGRRYRSGDASDDDGGLRRAFEKSPRLVEDQPVTPVHRRQCPALSQMHRPVFGDDLEKIQRLLPMLGEVFGHEIGKASQRDVLGLDGIHQRGQFVREACGLGRRAGASRDHGRQIGIGAVLVIRPAPHGPRPGHHQLREDQLSFELADGRGQVGGQRASIGGERKTFQQALILLGFRDRPDRRQQHRPSATNPEESRLQRTGGTPGWQQDRHRREVEHVRLRAAHARQIPVEQGLCQCVEKRPARFDVEDIRVRFHARSAFPHPPMHWGRRHASRCPAWRCREVGRRQVPGPTRD